jgi:GMP synthase-like glutamine amidotransferase
LHYYSSFRRAYLLMTEILIFRHVACEGPGYLAHYLRDRDIAWRTICIDQGDTLPASIDRAAGLVFMGGPMSVNDDLPWIEDSMELIRAAHRRSTPVLGHCLGAQLIARALGGEVRAGPVPEIGWLPVNTLQHPRQPAWCRALPQRFEAFHWHGEALSPPRDAVPLFYSEHCENQGFRLDRSLAIQFHVEMLPEMVNQWADIYADELYEPSETVQSRSEMTRHYIADQIYSAWLKGSP